MILDDTQRAMLRTLADDASTDAERRRNARIMLAYDSGEETRVIAAAVRLSESRTRYWRNVFDKHGMDMFAQGFAPPVMRRPVEEKAPLPALGLSEEERDFLRARLDADADGDIRKRAVIILGYADGRDTAFLARETGLSASRTRYWRKAFEKDGMRIFSTRSTEGAVKTAHDSDRSRRPGLRGDDPFAEAGRKVLRMYFEDMLAQDTNPATAADPDLVHRMRVATRRLRSAFEIFDAAFTAKTKRKFGRPLRRLARVLGRVRDLDVLLENMRAYAAALTDADAESFAPLLQAWEEERMVHCAILDAHLASDAYHRFREEFRAFVDTPGAGAIDDVDVIPGIPRRIKCIVPVLVLERYTDVLAFEPHLSTASIDLLHRLRIHCKKLRYTMECFAELLGPGGRKTIRYVVELQNYLGELQDGQAAADMITDFVSGLDARQSSRPMHERLNPAPLLTYLAGRETRKHELLVGFAAHWSRFNSPDMRKRMLRCLIR